MTDLRPDDRVLVIEPGPDVPLEAWARQLAHGLLVIAAVGDAVYELRRKLRDHSNVMITGRETDGVIPWRDGFFTVLVAAAGALRQDEGTRVLAPEGRIVQT